MDLQKEIKTEKGFHQMEMEENSYNPTKRNELIEEGSDRDGKKLKGNAYEEAAPEKEYKLVASLKHESEYKDWQIVMMQQKYNEMLASYRQAVNELVEKIDIKNEIMEGMEQMHQGRVNMLHNEAAKLSGTHMAEIRNLRSQNMELSSELRLKCTALEKGKTRNYLECTRFEKEIKELKEKLLNPTAAVSDNNNSDSEVTVLRAELVEKSEALQSMESLNTTLVFKELESREELQEARNESITIREDMEENSDYLESLNNTLMLKELISRRELQEARSESITSLMDMLTNRTSLVIKRLGEIDGKAFQDSCLKKFPNGDWEEISAMLCSSWEEYVGDPNWHPFKTVSLNGKLEEIVDEDDERLRELRNEYGEAAFKTVANALMELNEHNPSGRYLVSEVWNSKERRIATMKEIVEYLVKQVKSLKRKR